MKDIFSDFLNIEAEQIVQPESTVETNQIEGYQDGDGVALYIYTLPVEDDSSLADPGDSGEPKSNLIDSLVLTATDLVKSNFVITLTKK